MLSTIGQASIRRVVTGGHSTNRAILTIFNIRRTPKLHTNEKASVRAPSYRTYATTTAKSKSTPKKVAGTGSSPKTKSTGQGAPTTKTKKAVKKPIKKVVAKPKPRVLSEKAKEIVAKQVKALTLRELKAKALEIPHPKPNTPYPVFISKEYIREGTPVEAFKAVVNRYKLLTAEEKEPYIKIAAQNSADNKIAYKKWVESYSADQIREANIARSALRKLSLRYPKIQDPRAPTRPTNAFLQFVIEHFSGQQQDSQTTVIKDAAARWKSMSPSERQPYVDREEADRLRYQQEYKTVYHRETPGELKAKAAVA